MASARDQIVQCATELMWRRGYTRTSVDEIIRAAEVCKGSFYHHFPSKESLGFAVIERWTTGLVVEIAARLSDERSALENLDAILDTSVETQRDNGYLGCLLGRLALEMGDSAESFRLRLDEAFDVWRGLVTKYLEEAGMPPGRSAAYAGFMLATLEGGLMLSKIAGRGEKLETVVEHLKSGLRGQLADVAA